MIVVLFVVARLFYGGAAVVAARVSLGMCLALMTSCLELLAAGLYYQAYAMEAHEVLCNLWRAYMALGVLGLAHWLWVLLIALRSNTVEHDEMDEM